MRRLSLISDANILWFLLNQEDSSHEYYFIILLFLFSAEIHCLHVASLTWLIAHSSSARSEFTKFQRPPPSLASPFLFTPNCTDVCTYAHHRGVFHPAKWGYGLIFLDVPSVFVTNSHNSQREECQQGCRLGQASTSDQCREEGEMQEELKAFPAFLSTYRGKIQSNYSWSFIFLLSVMRDTKSGLLQTVWLLLHCVFVRPVSIIVLPLIVCCAVLRDKTAHTLTLL